MSERKNHRTIERKRNDETKTHAPDGTNRRRNSLLAVNYTRNLITYK